MLLKAFSVRTTTYLSWK